MVDQYNCDFHRARAEAERRAAANAASDTTGALHIRLAELHAEYASFFGSERAVVTTAVTRRRTGRSLRSGLSDRLPPLLVHA